MLNDPPAVCVESVRKVYANEQHNAFTDLCRFRGEFYLTFRSCSEGHGVSLAARIIVLRSSDAQTWSKVLEFGLAQRDPRDPHFLVFQDKLWVYTGAWLVHPRRPTQLDCNEHLGYAVWSEDGTHWQGPTALEGTYGHYIWRAAAFGGRAYLNGRRKHGWTPSDEPEGPWQSMESAMLESDDGLVWHHKALFGESDGDETAFLFEPDGAVLALMRSNAGSNPALLCKAQPPYRDWARTELDRNVGGPFVAKWGERYVVGGRKTLLGQEPRTALYWLADDQLREFAELPSGGDTSYPGLVALDDAHALVSYYSSHGCTPGSLPPAAIYLAELRIG